MCAPTQGTVADLARRDEKARGPGAACCPSRRLSPESSPSSLCQASEGRGQGRVVAFRGIDFVSGGLGRPAECPQHRARAAWVEEYHDSAGPR